MLTIRIRQHILWTKQFKINGLLYFVPYAMIREKTYFNINVIMSMLNAFFLSYIFLLLKKRGNIYITNR